MSEQILLPKNRLLLLAICSERLLDTDGLSITLSQQPQMLGSKWAHPIPMLETGCMLLATEKLDGCQCSNVFEANMFFEGYSGWEFDQLIDELESKYWVVASCSSHLIHEVSETSSNLSEEVLQLMAGRYLELSRKPKQDDA
ncbi:uncharacterized protein LOC141813565 [Curcuma longa]|uniref:uncharacterized protein LOC141813565 n=1 Tax=Curcuma longa TaxID=136217 RepID=UPI003D9F8B84